MADLNIKKDQTVQTADGRQGIVRYIGDIHVPGVWLGLELPDSTGKNDGSVKGTAYFTCSPGHGIFVRKDAVVKILRQPTPAAAPVPAQRSNSATPTINGASARPRPSGVMPVDIARKRQSLMSAGSGSTTGSRLSVRVIIDLSFYTLPIY
jgi:dynactin 1